MRVNSSGKGRLQVGLDQIRDVLRGLMGYEVEQEMRRQQAMAEDLFVLVTLGDMVGVPVIRSYYTLRFLPYMVETLEVRKRRLLRPRGAGGFV